MNLIALPDGCAAFLIVVLVVWLVIRGVTDRGEDD